MRKPQLRILVVLGPLVAPQLEVWRSAAARVDLELLVVGSTSWYWPGHDCDMLGVPTGLPSVLVEPSGFVNRGPLWWMYGTLPHVLAHYKPDIVHVHSEAWGTLVQQVLWLRGRYGYRLVVHGADNMFTHGGFVEALVRRIVLSLVLPRIDAYVSWNATGRHLAVQHGLNARSPTAVIPAVVPDPAAFAPIVKPGGGEEVHIVSVGRLVPEKGFDWLIDAVDGVRASKQEIRLTICGGGPDLEALRARANAKSLSVHFVGELRREDVVKIMQAADIVVVPSVTTPLVEEQFGLVALEAMLLARPLIVSNCGELPEIAADAAVVVPQRDVARLTDALLLLSSDSSLRASLGAAGRLRALAEYSPAAVAGRLATFWHDLGARD